MKFECLFHARSCTTVGNDALLPPPYYRSKVRQRKDGDGQGTERPVYASSPVRRIINPTLPLNCRRPGLNDKLHGQTLNDCINIRLSSSPLQIKHYENLGGGVELNSVRAGKDRVS